MRVLRVGIWRPSYRAGGTGGSAVPVAFHEMNLRHRRQSFQIFQRKNQRTIDHAVDQQAMLSRIDVRRFVPVGNDVMQWRRSDHANRILKRSSESEVLVIVQR